MADLIDRLTLSEEVTGRPEISGHDFSSYFVLYALGLATKPEIVARFDLQGDEATQGNQLATAIDGEGNAAAKHRFAHRSDAIFMLLDNTDSRYADLTDPENPVIDKVKIQADLGI